MRNDSEIQIQWTKHFHWLTDDDTYSDGCNWFEKKEEEERDHFQGIHISGTFYKWTFQRHYVQNGLWLRENKIQENECDLRSKRNVGAKNQLIYRFINAQKFRLNVIAYDMKEKKFGRSSFHFIELRHAKSYVSNR